MRSHPNEAARAPGREKPGHVPWDYGNAQDSEASQGGLRGGASPCVRFKVAYVPAQGGGLSLFEEGETSEVGGQEDFWMMLLLLEG